MTRAFDTGLATELADLQSANLLRLPEVRPAGLIDLCSNDYLGFGREPLPACALEVASGAGASRLVFGHWPTHEAAETELARWLGFQSCLLFSSGYCANLAVLSTFATAGDLIVSDELNHASIIDGCRLSEATRRIVRHLDVEAVCQVLTTSEARSKRRRFVVVESYFSMDGDIPNLKLLREVCDEHDAVLIVDEAHALGVFGSEGAGLCSEAGIQPDILIGTFGKSFGLQGAFVCASRVAVTYLWNRARGFVFSTGISPALAVSISERLVRVRLAGDRRDRLRSTWERFRTELGISGRGPILPLMVGDEGAAIELAGRMRAGGLLVKAIRPPTVPRGTARLRFTLNGVLDDEEVHRALSVVSRETASLIKR